MNHKNRVGLGTFPLSGVFREIGKDEAKLVVRRFLELGGYYIDTAPLYGFGEVEELLGEVFTDFSRDDYFLMTKCGIVGIEEKEKRKSSKYDDVILECYKSLKRLGADYFDLYFVHSPDPETPYDETITALKELKDEGKIKHIGVSNVSLEELERYNTTELVEYVQNRFSLINRSINSAMQIYFMKHNIQLVPYNVLELGQLTEDILHDPSLREGDLRKELPEWEKHRLDVIVEWAEQELKPVANELGIDLELLAIAWTLHQPQVCCPIVGMTTVDQVEENLRAGDIKLSDRQLAAVDRAFENLRKNTIALQNLDVHEFRGLNEKYS